MRKILLPLVLLLISNLSVADSCGIGKVIQVVEGGWNTDDFMLKIDYSGGNGTHVGTEFNGFIVFKNSLNLERYNGIRSIAISSLMTGKNVTPYSHNNNCSDATSLSISI